MNAADRKFLKELSSKVEETHEIAVKTHANVNFILNDVRVNGQQGFQPIMVQSYAAQQSVRADVAELREHVGVLWALTEAGPAKDGVLAFVEKIR